jgi:Flp pilus assembly protein TadD
VKSPWLGESSSSAKTPAEGSFNTADGYQTQLGASLAGRYHVVRELGRGGMAYVYLARDLKHDREVAIKLLRPELAAGIGTDRFLREIRIEAALQHPHILGLIDSGTVEWRTAESTLPYYVMPYIAGESLRERLLREKQLPLDETIHIAAEVADALDYAHSRGVVHRDIKPGNILLAGTHAWVTDFGIARAVTMASGEELTEAGLAVGTPDYMSPEQASADSAVDGRSDVYALGCVIYELLTGEPPFRGRTPQAIIARHRSEPPPSLRVVRPSVPSAVESAVQKALAKIPADRYPNASGLVRALQDPSGTIPIGPARTVSRRRWVAWVAAAGCLGVGALAARELAQWNVGELDPNRVVVFPLSDPARSKDAEGSGEGVATYLGYALEETAPLKWLDGWDFLAPSQRMNPASLQGNDARKISRAQRAGFYLDGAIVRSADSVTVVLRLHDVAGDSVVRRAGSSGRTDVSLPQLGLKAISGLLTALVQPGGRVDVSALSDREPGAVANFLQGERAYRRMRFAEALEHYKRAVSMDSGLVYAGLKGALAANWQELTPEAATLLHTALQHRDLLPAKYGFFADGLSAYLAGAADSAVGALRRTLEVDPGWSEAWMVLGEVHYHLMPRGTDLDSLAKAAFEEALRLDPQFTPALNHLAWMALRRGDLKTAGSVLAALQEAGSDSVRQIGFKLMLDCASRGMESIDWGATAAVHPTEVLVAAQLASSGVAQPACARAGYEAALHSERLENRWGALLGLQTMLVAQGRHNELRSLLGSQAVIDLPGRKLFLWDATADSALKRDADSVTAALLQPHDSMSSPNLWLLGQWASRQEKVLEVQDIAAVLEKRSRGGGRVDSLLDRVFAAHIALLRADTTSALRHFQALTPNAPTAELMWQPWEALAGERLTFARLLLALGRFPEAYQAAAGLENHRAVAFLIYLPASLEIRAEAAESMGRSDLAARHRSRLRVIRAPTAGP